MSKKREILKQVSSVPALPEVVMQLRKLCNDENVGYNKIAAIIERDPSLTASLLRLANSAYFGGAGRISSVQFAMTRLGLKRVYQMALTISLAPIANVELGGYGLDPHQLWEHSLATAMIAEKLAADRAGLEPSDAYTAGLLHDMGKVVLSTFVDIDKEAIRRGLDEEGLAFDEAEQAALGVDHASIAAALLRRWQIPSAVSDAVRWHHRPSMCSTVPLLADVVHAADVLCLNVGWGLGSDGLCYRMDDAAVERLGLNRVDAECVVAAVHEEIAEVMSMFMVPLEA